jgi:tetratricopeptide (TPR) repeat protein
MLLDHPSVEDFEGFLRNPARPGQTARNTRVLRHLLAGCTPCFDELQAMGWPPERLERLLHLPAGEAAPRQADGWDYGRAFAKAEEAVSQFLTVPPPPAEPAERLLAELALLPAVERISRLEKDGRFATPQFVQGLIDRSHSTRYSDPEEMLHWALLARTAAERCSEQASGGAARLADLRAGAWAQFANALRVTGRLREAEMAMEAAQLHLSLGTGDPALRARLLGQMASLHTFKRRFDEAIAVLDEAAEIYRQLGETHALARTLVQEATASLYAGEPENGVRLLNQAIPLIDDEGDPHLLLAACHNLVSCYVDLDQPEKALSIYNEARELYKEFSDPLILLRAGWQEGQLLRDLGHLRAAEAALLRARAGFVERSLSYEAAVVSLDLAAIHVRLHQVEAVKQTVAATVPIFRALGVDREAIASLLQLQQVADQEQRALDLIRFLNARLEPLAKRSVLQ